MKSQFVTESGQGEAFTVTDSDPKEVIVATNAIGHSRVKPKAAKAAIAIAAVVIPDPDEPKKQKKPRRKRSYCVYVIELEPKVWRLRKKMRDANSRYNSLAGKGCLYVGMTVYSPEKRFLVHMDGGRNAAAVVTKFGRHLRPRLYKSYQRMSLADAEEMERYLAARLRKRGYAVWPVKEGGAFTMDRNGKSPGAGSARRQRRSRARR